MKRTSIPPSPVETQYIKYIGGLDLASPVLSLKPGNALDAMNYEPGLMGGYKRIDGFERRDGRPAPSQAVYSYLGGITGTLAVGDVITGATSGASGVVVFVDPANGGACVSKVAGQFAALEVLMHGGVVVGQLDGVAALRGCRDVYSDAQAMAAAADLYRADIGAVPGSGPVRGVWMYKGVLYAFRDNAPATACVMFKSTSSGWTSIALGEEINFSNAGVDLAEGATLTQGGVTATIKRVVLQTGALAGGVNTGRLILGSRTGGSFAAGAATAGTVNLSLTSSQSAIALMPGGRYEFVNSNFGGATKTHRMYGCSGVHRAFEFDGSTFVPINTGMASDKPTFITVHKKKLFLAFGSSVQFSGDGQPYQWTVLAGASELGIGDDITGMAVQAGNTLAVFARNSSHQLNGTSINNFELLPISDEVGALPYTVQNIGKTYALDDRGIISTDRTQAYGNFNQATISDPVQKVIEKIRAKAIGSVVYRNRSQYRILASDGSGVIVAFAGGAVVGITQLQYPASPTCTASCEDDTGKDVVFFGGADGFVYQADVGSSFDGAPIEAYLRMPFNNINSPRMRKRFRKVVMEMSSASYAAIRFHPEFSYGNPDVGAHRLQTVEVQGTGGYWDVSNWDEFFYDNQLVSSPEFSIEGTGLNMSLMFYSNSTLDQSHTLQGMIIHFTIRRLSR